MELSIKLFQEALDSHEWLISVREVMTDRGTHSYANKLEKMATLKTNLKISSREIE
jgi:hypothetical protein